jgi:hypothetical protein
MRLHDSRPETLRIKRLMGPRTKSLASTDRAGPEVPELTRRRSLWFPGYHSAAMHTSLERVRSRRSD